MKILDYAAIGAIRGYQWIVSPIMPMSCRFWPTCSHYGIEAIRRHGALRGGWLAIGRVLRCNPWNAGGVDPVPERFSLGAAFGASHAEHSGHGARCAGDGL
jgi:putative membrane protein insertion efficiency factor